MDPDEMVSLCAFHAGSGLFGIDTRQIREVLGAVAPQWVPLAPECIAGIMPYRGEVLTTVSLRALLGLERGSGAQCAIVLDNDNNEQFGLMVDKVGGVVTMARSALEANPNVLDTCCNTLFAWLYKVPGGPMVRLDPWQLRPSQLMEGGLPGYLKQERKNEHR
jgi:purine-binding chemotaxis protein CheW